MRHENWPELLAAEIEAGRGRPFQWGTHDCCSFAARVVEAMTGQDWRAYFSAYTDEATAAQEIEAYDGVEGIATYCLGQPIPPLCAQRGDVCLVDTPQGPALGICDGASVWCAAQQGLARMNLRHVTKAWRVA